ITDILIVLGRGKEPIKKYFTPSPALEDSLKAAGKTELWEIVKKTSSMANVTFVRQDKPLGSGDAVRKAARFAGNEPFALAWGDDLIFSEKPVMGQLIDAYGQTGTSILGVQAMYTYDIIKYGVVEEGKSEGRLHECLSVVEKPPLDKIPGHLASLGRYVLTSEVFAELAVLKPGLGGEIQFTDAVDALAKKGRMYDY
ncbi:MAG: UTP--glucose-1-phosphate uridylyltransferase, partial [Clostridiales bacterium]|nr:UTP--glucose-1-phosphate uridylyltransferase [Clostridiales bacterium]